MSKLEIRLNKYFPFFILCFLGSDFLTSLSNKVFEVDFYRYSGLVKLFAEVLMVLAIIFSYKKTSKILKILGLITTTFVVGQFLIKEPYNIAVELSQGNIYYFNRYIYLLVFIIFINSIKIKRQAFIKTYTYFERFLYLNSVVIIIGFLFHIELFRSYEYSERFGFSGLLSKPGEASFLYMTAIICNYYLWSLYRENIFLLKTILFITISLFLGQKKIFLFLFLLMLVHIIYKFKYRRIALTALSSSLIIMYFFRNYLIISIIKLSPFWEASYQQNGLLYVITSFRNVLLERAHIHVEENWNFLNYIFGGIKLGVYKTEFGFADVFFFFGIFGILYYIYIFSLFIKNKQQFTIALISTLFITSFFSGGLLLHVTAILIFYITTTFIIDNSYGTLND